MSLNYLKYKIKLNRKVIYFLLEFLEPSNKYVVRCSQNLDKLIVEYQIAAISANHKNILKNNHEKKSFHEKKTKKKHSKERNSREFLSKLKIASQK